jgi:uncharacterized membrane protein
MEAVINPISGTALSEDRSDFVRELRTVRRGARNATRSGNPAKRAEAARIEAMTPVMIAQVYKQDA